MKQLLCRDLKPGDILLKMATNSPFNRLVKGVQQLAGQANAFVSHAAIALDTQFVIEAQKDGVSANHLAMKDKEFGYIVYRPTNDKLGVGAATAAKLLFDINQKRGNVPYNAKGAFASVVGGPGKPKTAADMDTLLDRLMANKNQPFFCSQLVVYSYQWAASQSGIQPDSVLNVSDAKASPSVLASHLVNNRAFEEVGYMMPNER